MRAIFRLLRAGLLVMASWALWASSVAAQTTANDGFVLTKPGEIQTENLPATPFVFGAYAIVWIIVTVYVFSLWRRISRSEREIAALAARLESKGR